MTAAAKYRAPKLEGRVVAQLDQGLFDFLVPYRKPMLLPAEAGKCLARSADFVRDLITLGKLEAIAQAAKGEREVYVVTRRSVLLWLVERAQFDPADLQLCVRSTLESFDRPLLDFVIRTATELRARMS